MKAGWRLRCCDLGQCYNYEMAVWERKGEDKAIWRGSFWKKQTEKISGRLFLGEKEEGFWATQKGVRDFCRKELSCASDLPLRLTDS